MNSTNVEAIDLITTRIVVYEASLLATAYQHYLEIDPQMARAIPDTPGRLAAFQLYWQV